MKAPTRNGSLSFGEKISVPWNFIALLGGVIAVAALYFSATHSDREIAEAKVHAAQLEKETAEARLKLAGLQNDTARLNVEAETARARQREAEERTEQLRATIERNAVPRRITSLDTFFNVLKQAHPATAEILYDGTAPDAYLIATQFRASLPGAGWSITPLTGLGITALDPTHPDIVSGIPWPLIVSGRGSPWGVAIIGNRAVRQNDTSDPMYALGQAIIKSGVDSTIGWGIDERLPDNTFKIVIGHRTPSWPGPPQATEAKEPETQRK
jgi:hypothetical protein